jgi:hypothetical protein
VTEFVLANGLRVTIRQAREPKAEVGMRYRSGAMHAAPHVAHLAEHLSFEVRPGGVPLTEQLANIGILRFGATGDADTLYSMDVDERWLKAALWAEAHAMAARSSDGAAWDRVRAAVRRETVDVASAVERSRDAADRRAKELESAMLAEILGFAKDQSLDALDRVESAEVLAYIERYHVPSNAELTIYTHRPTGRVREWVEAYFGGLAPGDPEAASAVTPPLPTRGHRRGCVPGASGPSRFAFFLEADPARPGHGGDPNEWGELEALRRNESSRLLEAVASTLGGARVTAMDTWIHSAAGREFLQLTAELDDGPWTSEQLVRAVAAAFHDVAEPGKLERLAAEAQFIRRAGGVPPDEASSGLRSPQQVRDFAASIFASPAVFTIRIDQRKECP